MGLGLGLANLNPDPNPNPNPKLNPFLTLTLTLTKGATNTETSCETKLGEGTLPYPPDQLRAMLEISMADGAPPLYNEVVVDSQAYLQSLPHSIAAVAYYDDSTEEEQIKATETYLAMLQARAGRRPVVRPRSAS